MKAVEPVDQLFLTWERRQQPMHVGGLQLFSPPPDAGPDFVRTHVERYRGYARPRSPFDKRLVTRFGLPCWEREREVDLDLHLRHLALPRPGRIRELLGLVSAEHSIALDRDRPLWEFLVIEGLPDGKFAVYTKVHHGLMDGVSLMRLGMQAMSTDPTQRDLPPIWALPKTKPQREADASVSYYLQTLARYGMAQPLVFRETLKAGLRVQGPSQAVPLYGAPRSIFNQKITGSRRVAAQSYALSRIGDIAKGFGVTLNDAILAICGSALRGYLLSQNALPDRPLIAMVPMSLRDDESAGGNQFAICLADLGTHLAEPTQRLRAVQSSMAAAKTRYKQMTPEECASFSAMILAPTVYSILTGLSPKWLSFNVVISNVPGPRKPLYCNGARLEGIYPASLIVHQNALNLTITSYCDSLEFGLVGCRTTLPSMQRLLDHIEQGIVELERAASLPSPDRRENSTKAPFLLSP